MSQKTGKETRDDSCNESLISFMDKFLIHAPFNMLEEILQIEFVVQEFT